VGLVESYYRVLRQESEEGESILEISSFFLRKIFQNYLSQGRQRLVFRYCSPKVGNWSAASASAPRVDSRSGSAPSSAPSRTTPAACPSRTSTG
jgi:hypothetical protein